MRDIVGRKSTDCHDLSTTNIKHCQRFRDLDIIIKSLKSHVVKGISGISDAF